MHRLIDFKGFADAKLDLMKPFTLLIGKNGSGKSNAIEGVELLAKLAHGLPLHEVTDIGKSGGFEVRGGITRCARGEAYSFALEFSDATMEFEGEARDLRYELRVGLQPEVRVASEALRLGNRVLFEVTDEAHGVLTVRYDNFAKGPNKPTKQLAADRTVLSRYQELIASRKSTKLTEAELIADTLSKYLANAFVFDPSPRRCREPDRIGANVLGRHGQNLSPVLHALSEGSDDERKKLSRIRDRIRQVPEEPFEDFGFVVVEELGEVTFGFKPQGGGRLLSARVLSDGTLRALALLTALETAEEGSRIVIEEIDSGIHPSRVQVLLDAVWEASRTRKLNVLATTHNPATLNQLTHAQLEGVVLAHHDVEKSAADLVRLFDIPAIDVLLEQESLGELVTREVIESHLVPRFEANAREKAKAWLRSLP